MKLNNRGWGLNEMLLISGGLLLFLFVAAFYVFSLYNQLGEEDTATYGALETELVVAAEKYAVNNKLNYSSYEVISLNKLVVEDYIEKLFDKNNIPCNGYVILDNYNFEPYIKCNDFTTSGYNSSNE